MRPYLTSTNVIFATCQETYYLTNTNVICSNVTYVLHVVVHLIVMTVL